MERIKELARQLAERFGTADPFALCAALDITVLPSGCLPASGAFTDARTGRAILYLNGALEENERRTVCAHELGHALLHEGHNALFLRERTRLRHGALRAGGRPLRGVPAARRRDGGGVPAQRLDLRAGGGVHRLPAHIVEYCMTH